MKSCILIKIFAGIALASSLTGCVAPRITAPRAAELLAARAESEKIPIKSFTIKSTDRPLEIKHDLRLLAGTSQMVMYPKQAREFLAQDLRDYVSAKFVLDPSSEEVITLTLVQAYNYFTRISSGAGLIPFVGIVAGIADALQEVPFTFIAEVDVDARKSTNETASANIFVKRVETIPSPWETTQTQDNRYRKQLSEVRTELFEKLDQELLPMWKDRKFVGTTAARAESDTALLAYDLSRLDASLAEGAITREEHDAMTKAATERYQR
jgi:hypothetical protein